MSKKDNSGVAHFFMDERQRDDLDLIAEDLFGAAGKNRAKAIAVLVTKAARAIRAADASPARPNSPGYSSGMADCAAYR